MFQKRLIIFERFFVSLFNELSNLLRINESMGIIEFVNGENCFEEDSFLIERGAR